MVVAAAELPVAESMPAVGVAARDSCLVTAAIPGTAEVILASREQPKLAAWALGLARAKRGAGVPEAIPDRSEWKLAPWVRTVTAAVPGPPLTVLHSLQKPAAATFAGRRSTDLGRRKPRAAQFGS